MFCATYSDRVLFFGQIFYYLTGEGEGNIEGDYYEIELSTYLVEGGEFTSELS